MAVKLHVLRLSLGVKDTATGLNGLEGRLLGVKTVEPASDSTS